MTLPRPNRSHHRPLPTTVSQPRSAFYPVCTKRLFLRTLPRLLRILCPEMLKKYFMGTLATADSLLCAACSCGSRRPRGGRTCYFAPPSLEAVTRTIGKLALREAPVRVLILSGCHPAASRLDMLFSKCLTATSSHSSWRGIAKRSCP